MPERDPSRAIEAGAVLRQLMSRFKSAGLETPGLDARLLLEAATGLPREALVAVPERLLDAGQIERVSSYAVRRLAHEPVSRILGRREFWGRGFEVTPDTLDPRPDTETMIEAALGIARQQGWIGKPLRVLDIGAGTGCLLLTLLAELPSATGIGTDLSQAALDVARRNSARLGLDARAAWLCTDLVEGVAGPFDLVVSNPPYIPSGDIAGLEPGVRQFDPRLALDGGADGLAVYRALVPKLRRITTCGGWALVEVGAGQAEAVVDLVRDTEGPQVATAARRFFDLAGHVRCVAWQPQS